MKRLFSHVSLALIEGALVAALVAALMVGTAFAGKGGNKPSGGGHGGSSAGTLSLVMVTDRNADGAPNWGDTVTFNAYTSATPEPHVQLKCTQDATVVYTHEAGMYASYPWPWEQDMTLSSSAWTGGAASCTAQLFYYSGTRTVWGTTLSFAARA